MPTPERKKKKKRNRLPDIENKLLLTVTKGERRRGIVREFGIEDRKSVV